MRRLAPETRYPQVNAVKLFRDDLEGLMKLMSAPDAPAKLVSGNCEFDSVDELQRERGDTLKALRIESNGLTVDLGKNCWIWGIASSDAERLVCYRVRDYLTARSRPLSRFATPLDTLGFIAFGITAVLLSLSKVVPTPVAAPVALICLVLAVVFAPLWGIQNQCGSLICLKRRHEMQSFFRRKKDDLLMLLIGSIVGVVGTLIVQHLTSHSR